MLEPHQGVNLCFVTGAVLLVLGHWFLAVQFLAAAAMVVERYRR